MILKPRGLAGALRLAPEVTVDPEAGLIARGSEAFSFGDLRFLEVQQGFLTVGTALAWLTIDLERYRDEGGKLISGGAFSPSAVGMIEWLRQAIDLNAQREKVSGTSRVAPVLDFRYRVRIDRTGIFLTLLSVGILLADLRHLTDHWLISPRGLLGFGALLLAATAALVVSRRARRLRLDDPGITLTGLGKTRFHPWSGIREFRKQHAELELVGEGFRIPINLELLTAGGTPLILRRGPRAFLSPPARLLFTWLRSRTVERSEPPLELPSRERWQARLWVTAAIALNAAVFVAEMPQSGDRFQRLTELGARTGDWAREPWRLLTSLFLHGSPSHLFFNMLMLAVLAPWTGRIFGWGRTSALYLGGGILGNLLSELAQGAGPRPPAVGASTAILALLGALLAATYLWPERIPLAARARFRWAIPVTLFLTLGMGMVIPVIDNGAHLGGFAAGLALTWPLRPRGKSRDLAMTAGDRSPGLPSD